MRASVDQGFQPSKWLRSPHLQSMLASSGLRRVVRGRLSRQLERNAEWVRKMLSEENA